MKVLMGKSSIDIYIDVFFSNCHYRRVALSMCMIVYAWRDKGTECMDHKSSTKRAFLMRKKG